MNDSNCWTEGNFTIPSNHCRSFSRECAAIAYKQEIRMVYGFNVEGRTGVEDGRLLWIFVSF